MLRPIALQRLNINASASYPAPFGSGLVAPASHQPLLSPSADRFVRFGTTAKPGTIQHDPAFTALGLTPSVATHQDLPQVAKLGLAFISEGQEYSLHNTFLSLQGRPEPELKGFFAQVTPVPPGSTFEDLWPHLQALMKDYDAFKAALLGADNLEEQEEMVKTMYQKRFIDNPQGALLILKNKQDEVVAMEGINQFQLTHDMNINQGDYTAIDPKHALLSSLYIRPDYRNQGLGRALKKATMAYAREPLGYTYVWASTDPENASHHINTTHLQYTRISEATQFSDSPAFTPALIKTLIDNYETGAGTRQLWWRRIAA